jgi:tetratricopeptide (TPR) repeat protein
MGLHAPVGLLADYLLNAAELGRYAGSPALNTDDTLWLEFSAPRTLYESRNAELNYRILRSYRSTDLPALVPADRTRVETAEGRFALGRAFLGKGISAEAEVEFARAGRANPLYAPSRLEEARLLIQRGMALKAIQIPDQVLARNSREAEAHFLRGEAYRQQGMLGQALAAYDRAVMQAPDSVECRLHLTAMLREQGAMDRARTEFEAARHLQPLNFDVLFPLAEFHLTQAHPEQALTTLQPLLANLGQYPATTRARIRQLTGFTLLRARRFREAIDALEAAAVLDPVDAGIRLDLAQAYEESGNLQRATDTLDHLLSFHPGHLLARQRLTALLARLEVRQE